MSSMGNPVRRRRPAARTALSAAAALGMLVLSGPRRSAAAADNPATRPLPPAATPATAGTTQPVVAVASVEAFWSAEMYAKSSGYLSELKADIGDHVTKGQVMAVIDVPELEKELMAARATLAAKREMTNAAAAAVEQAQAALEVAKRLSVGARADRELSEATLKRQEELFEGKAATSQQIDEARAKAEVARAAAAVAEAKIATAEADLKSARAAEAVAKANADVAAAEAQKVEALVAYTRITAPFDGVVTRRLVSPGDLVQAATASRTTPLFTVQRIDTVRVFCDVPEIGAAGVRVGDVAEVKVYSLGGGSIRGAVTRISAALNPGTRTMRAEIDLPNPAERLRPGMYAQVTLTPARVAASTGQ